MTEAVELSVPALVSDWAHFLDYMDHYLVGAVGEVATSGLQKWAERTDGLGRVRPVGSPRGPAVVSLPMYLSLCALPLLLVMAVVPVWTPGRLKREDLRMPRRVRERARARSLGR